MKYITKDKYVIFDWMYNVLDKHGEFNSFEDGWAYIYEHFEEEDFQELEVLTMSERALL